MATAKKVTRVSGSKSDNARPVFVPTAESKSQAGKFRMYAIILWVLAVIAQIVGIWILSKYAPLTTGQRIGLIGILAADLILLIAGSSFWKKANRFDPPSKASALFGVKSQLGVIMAVVCFLPVIIVSIIKKEWLVLAAAIAMMIGGGAASADYNPASQEEYAEQILEVETLTGQDFVYWTKSGTKFHLYNECRYINTSKTTEIFEGSVADARKEKNITELCSACKTKVMKEKGISDEQLKEAQDAAKNALENIE